MWTAWVVWVMYSINNSMAHISFGEAKSSSANQKIIHILRKPNFHYHIHKDTQLAPLLIHVNLVHNLPFFLLKINIILQTRPSSSNWALSLSLPHQNPVTSLQYPMCATRSSHPVLRNLITCKVKWRVHIINRFITQFSPVLLSAARVQLSSSATCFPYNILLNWRAIFTPV